MEATNILVFEDEEGQALLTQEALTREGFNVEFYQTGKAGLEKVRQKDFNIFIIDMNLPDMYGLEILKKIREIKSDPIAIMVTAHGDEGKAVESMKLGAFDYITKSPNMAHLKAMPIVIKEAIGRHALIMEKRRLEEELAQQNIKLEEKVKERTSELSLLYNIGQDVASSLKLEEVLKTIVDRVTKALDLEICSILLIDKKTGELVVKAAYGLDPDVIPNKTRVKIDPSSVAGWVVQNMEAVLVEDIEKDTRFAKKSLEKYYTHSFISTPLLVQDEIIGVMNVNNKKSKQSFNQDDLRFIQSIANSAAVAIDNARLYKNLQDVYIRIISTLTTAIDAKDHYTGSHSEHVTVYATAIAEQMSLSSTEIEDIRNACQLHDLGKIGIPDGILTNPGKLSPEEWETMRAHSLKGVEILEPLGFLDNIIELIKHHHERYDGGGYPDKIKGEEIPLGARIIAVADAFDAMTSERPYRKALSLETAIAELEKNRNAQFDSKVVDAFLTVLKNRPDILRAR